MTTSTPLSVLALLEVADDTTTAAVTILLVAAGLLVAVVWMRRAETARRAKLLDAVLAQVADGTPATDRTIGIGGDRGRPATLRRRRGGEWDTPVVPTVSTSPHRSDRRRTRRI